MSAKNTEHAAKPTANDASAAPTTLVGRLRSRFGGVVALVAKRPLWQKAIAGIVVVLMIGTTGWLTLSGSGDLPVEEVKEHTFADALEALKSGDYESARTIALELKDGDKLGYDDRGGPAYIQGMIAASEAADVPYPDEQRRMYLIAARYLDSAAHDDFAQATSTDGLIQLGECWYRAGGYARALPYLTQALKRRPRREAYVHWLLAGCYRRDSNPQLKLALEHLEKYLANRMLSPSEREAAIVEQARVYLDMRKAPDAEAALARIPEKSELAAAVNLLRARLLMQQAEAALPRQAQDPDATTATKKLFEQAMELLRTPAGRDAISQQAHREGQYLLGVCYLKLGDYRAAEHQFSRTRRVNIGLPEGIAAAMEEADLQRLQGKDEAAIELYKELLRDLGDLRDYSNPWLPLDALRDRMLAAYRHYRDAEKYEVALTFARSLAPLLAPERMLELEAEVLRRWAERLATQSSGGDDARSTTFAAQSRARYHDAAQQYYKLAKQSLATRDYPDYLWQSAECYRLAQDYHRTSRVMRMYLDQYQPQRRADALLAIGEAELALNNLEASLVALRELLRDDPKHPLSYRARLVMHEVFVEQNKYAEARKMLVENLEHEALTPQSIEWRDSLFALAEMLYRQGLELEATSRDQGVDNENEELRKPGLKSLEQAAQVLHEAILKYTEALARYPDAPQSYEARYLLAECYRQAAKWPRKKMPGVTIETTRASLTRQMHEELHAAQKLYHQLIDDLNAKADQQPLTQRERDLLRNAYFLKADALFELGKYEEAIHAYSSATNRYQTRPEALEAFVQIASCYRLLDEPAKARGTLEQAKVVLRRIPPDVVFDKTTRFSRDEWVTLLDFLSTM